jgi:hypothetical protein
MRGNSEVVTSTIRTFTCVGAAAAVLVVCLSSGARAADPTPLRVPDTSSPRATLQGFIQTTDDLYTRWTDLLTSYWYSGELYPTVNQRKLQANSSAAFRTPSTLSTCRRFRRSDWA